jgi:CheY-like chemotaxis protein
MFAAQQFTDRCLASGADDVVTEPMGLDELLDLLGRTVRERAEVVLS